MGNEPAAVRPFESSFQAALKLEKATNEGNQPAASGNPGHGENPERAMTAQAPVLAEVMDKVLVDAVMAGPPGKKGRALTINPACGSSDQSPTRTARANTHHRTVGAREPVHG